MIRVLLVDDQSLLRMGFRLILEAEADIEVIGEAGDGAAGVSMAAALSPDVVLINLANPHRDELEELFALSRAMARPVAMFVDQSDTAGIEAAVDAGVSAYVVDGLKKERIRPVLELAIRRFRAYSRLRAELDEARGALAERKAIDQAKALLMKKRGIDEPAAYAALRKAAMDSGRRIGDVADAIVTADRLMGDL